MVVFSKLLFSLSLKIVSGLLTTCQTLREHSFCVRPVVPMDRLFLQDTAGSGPSQGLSVDVEQKDRSKDFGSQRKLRGKSQKEKQTNLKL